MSPSLRISSLVFLLILHCGLPAALAAPPPNDNFSSAAVISGLPAVVTGSNVEATRQTGEPNSPMGYDRASVWWTWTAPVSGWTEVNTLGSTFDTGLAVFTGTEVGALTLLQYNDAVPATEQSRLRLQTTAGTTYSIQVQGWFGANGNIRLEIKPAPAPQPPALQILTLSPDTQIVAAFSAGMTDLEIEFTAPEELMKIELIMIGPRGDPSVTSWSFEEMTLLSGDRLGGRLRACFFTITDEFTTDGGPSKVFGDWSATLKLTDRFGSVMRYGGEGQSPLPAGSNSVLHLLPSGPIDLRLPSIVSASVTPQIVDVTSSAQTLQVEVIAADDVGLVGDIDLYLLGPAGGSVVGAINWTSHTGTSTNRTSRGTLVVRPLPAGTYDLMYWVYDITGKGYTIQKTTSPAVPGIPITITVLNSGITDNIAPKMLAVSTSAPSAPAVSPATTIDFTVDAVDNIGITGVSLRLLQGFPGTHVSMQLVSGTPQAGRWSGSLDFDGTSVPGTYPIAIYLEDLAGNASRYQQNLLSGQAFPPGAATTFTVTPGPNDAYSVWRAGFPGLDSASGEPFADADADGYPNVLEFTCGTHPLLSSLPDGPDPLGSRAPVFTFTPTHIQVEFCLSRENYRLGGGSYWELKAAWSENLEREKNSSRAFLVTKDLFRYQIPRGTGSSLFGWLKVVPSTARITP
jgi:hypothetical protein